MANKCSVSLEKLSNDDIEQINAMLQNKPEDSSSATQSGEDKPVKKVSLHPRKQPSNAQIRAQKLIDARNAKIHKKEIVPPIYKSPEVTPLQEPAVTIDESSSDTIICTPPRLSMPAQPSNRNPKVKFVIRTVGIKHFRDTKNVLEANTQR